MGAVFRLLLKSPTLATEREKHYAEKDTYSAITKLAENFDLVTNWQSASESPTV